MFTPGHTLDSISLKLGNIIFCGNAAMNGFPSMKRITIWIEDKKAFQSSWNVLLADMTGGGDKMIHIAICDDETCMSDTIRKMVSDFFGMKNTEITIVQFSSGEELLSYEKSIDILFHRSIKTLHSLYKISFFYRLY